MTMPEITPDEQVELDRALYEALNPLAAAVRSRQTGLPVERMWDADPAEVALSVLATWKLVDLEVKRLTATAAATAGSYGANYERLGSAWGITRQGARKKWPEAVPRPVGTGPRTLELFGGTAELAQSPDSTWGWRGTAADGAAGEGAGCPGAEEAAAHAGVFLREHSS